MLTDEHWHELPVSGSPANESVQIRTQQRGGRHLHRDTLISLDVGWVGRNDHRGDKQLLDLAADAFAS